jgi:ribonucrease Y
MGLFQRLTGAFRPVSSPPTVAPQGEVAPQTEDTTQLTAAQARAAEILSDAQQKVTALLAEAQQEHDETLQGTETRQQRLQSLESRLAAAQQQLAQSLEAKKLALDAQTQATDAQDVAFASLEQTLLERLETSLDHARSELEVTLADQANDSWSQYLTERLEVEQEILDQTALDLLLTAAPVGSHHVAIEYHAPVISLTQTPFLNDLKSAQNDIIPILEAELDVECSFLPEEETLKLRSHNATHKEIARRTLEELKHAPQWNVQELQKLREHYTRQVESEIQQAGDKLVRSVNAERLSPLIRQALGRFLLRYSYGQNMIAHTLEETKIGVRLAYELGVDTEVVRQGCLFHDIGKVAYEEEGNHVETGVKFLQDQGFPPEVVNCVAESHEDVPFSSVESQIVHLADAASGMRPGARFDDLEGFIKHQEMLMNTAMSQDGVVDAFVMNGGRELRVVVDSQRRNDQDLTVMAGEIRDQVAEQSTYPGTIAVVLIRQVRHTAKAA